MMKRMSTGVIAAIVFWIIYGVACAVLLFRATAGVQRDLLIILGGFGLATAAIMGICYFVLRSRGRERSQ